MPSKAVVQCLFIFNLRGVNKEWHKEKHHPAYEQQLRLSTAQASSEQMGGQRHRLPVRKPKQAGGARS
jgi:hypothetical protein